MSGSKQKPELYYFSKFVRELMNKGEVYIYGRTYKESNSSLTIKSLVQEVCDFHNDSRIGEIVRKTAELDSEESRKKRVTDKQKNILKEVEFYFNEGYDSIDSEKRLDVNRTNFYIDNEGLINFVYPKFSKEIYESVINTIKDNNFEDLYKYISLATRGNGPFSELFLKIKEDGLLRNNGLLTQIEERFKYFTDIYIKKFSEAKDNNGPNEEYNIYRYSSGFYRSLQLFPHKDLNHYPDNLSNFFTDQEDWFDKEHHQRIEFVQPYLSEVDIRQWPKWSIEHIIFTELEYICIRNYLVDIIISEIQENIRFNFFTSATGTTLDVQSNITDLKELSKKMNNYRFPGGIKHHVDVKRGMLIEGNFGKNPNKLISQNEHTPGHIEFVLREAIINYLSSILSQKVRLDSDFTDQLSESVTQKIYS